MNKLEPLYRVQRFFHGLQAAQETIERVFADAKELADDEALLLWIGGIPCFLSNIGLRMLAPHELFRAMGFLDDYIINRDYLGKEYTKSTQVARCGNAACPPVAGALVAANLIEYALPYYIVSMKELWDQVAV